MTSQLVADNKRPCEGQPGRMCPNDCDVDCDLNAATLDRVMNYPLRRVQCSDLPQPTEPAQNLPYDLIAPPAWLWPGLPYAGALGGICFGLYRYFF